MAKKKFNWIALIATIILVIVVIVLIFFITIHQVNPLKKTCEELGGIDKIFLDPCSEGTYSVRAKDSCKSCHCCVPIE